MAGMSNPTIWSRLEQGVGNVFQNLSPQHRGRRSMSTSKDDSCADEDLDALLPPELPVSTIDVDLDQKAKELGIKYFLVSYTPLNADTRVSLIPRRAIRDVQRFGCGIPAAMFFKADGTDPEMYLIPDPKTLIQLPWKPEYGWVSSNIYMSGRPFPQCPRGALIRQVVKARKEGYVMKSGVEPEFMLLSKDGQSLGDERDARQAMCLQEPLATLRNAPLLIKIYEVMEKLGWEPYEIDHEASCCQYEINFGFVEALAMADRHSFMKFMIKELAELEGVTATFMPIPYPGLLCANGLHVNVSLWSTIDDSNLFKDSSDEALGLSAAAYHFIGGLMQHADASCALLCPTVNSYKRLNAGSWCPNSISWGGNNRTVMFRVPANNRVEHRLADGTANPYLIQAAILAAGMDGILNKLEPGDKCDGLVSDFPGKYKTVPRNLLDAMRAFEASDFFKEALGHKLVDGFVFVKQREWDLYMGHLSQWERDFYLNC